MLWQTECKCSVKTVIVPFADVAAWSDALAVSPYGWGAVVPRGPYLGISLGGGSAYPLIPGSQWSVSPDATKLRVRATVSASVMPWK